jgi:glycosyltransferase involved in cell wall biosynthesis
MNKPLFSILLPTYNRAHLLPLAIKSVLQQTLEDFELIISNGGSTDNTRDVVAGFTDSRICYLETDTKLSMGDNYELALNNASGDYIIFFSDDDAFIPAMLEKLKRVIDQEKPQMIAFPIAYYYYDDGEGFGYQIKKNSLVISRFSSELKQIESDYAIKRLLNMTALMEMPEDNEYFHPMIGNIVCHHSIFEQIKSKTPKLFPIIPVDVYVVTLILGLIRKFYVLDEPLLVWSSWNQNSSVGIKTVETTLRQHYEKLLNGEVLQYVPLKFALPLNCSANAMLKAKNDLGGSLDYLQLDWVNYYARMHEYLIYIQGEGVDTSQELNELNQVLSEQPIDLQNQVRAATSQVSFRAKQILKKNLPFGAKALKLGVQAAKKSLGTNINNKFTIIKGGSPNLREI